MKLLNEKELSNVSGGHEIFSAIAGGIIGNYIADVYAPGHTLVRMAATLIGVDVGAGIFNWALYGSSPSVVVVDGTI